MSHYDLGPAKAVEPISEGRAAAGTSSAELGRLIAELRVGIDTKNREIEELRHQLRAIHTSDAWAMLRTMTQLRHTLAPHGTRRDQLAKLTVRALRRIKKGTSRFALDARGIVRSLMSGESNAVRIDQGAKYNYAILCLPMIEWGFRFQRPQQIMRQFAQAGHAVCYAANRFHRGDEPKLRGVEQNIVEVFLPGDPVANVYQTLPTPSDTEQMVRAISSLRTAMNLREVIIVVQLPYWTELAVALRDQFGWPIVYDCMDDHSGFLHNSGNVLETEDQLVSTADLVVTSSALLHQGVERKACASILIRNACEYDHFQRSEAGGSSIPGSPVIGYYGAIAEWFDSELMAAIVRLRPKWRFELIGSTLAGDVRSLEDLSNLRFLGEQPYADLPRLIGGWDAFVIPFKRIPLTEATNPVKVYEMLATGKPVVAVGLPELMPIADLGLIQLAASADEFASAIDWSLSHSTPELVKRRQDFASHNTWQARAGELATAIDAIRRRPELAFAAKPSQIPITTFR